MAELLLKQYNLNISEIVDKTHVVDLSYVNGIFKKYSGQNPSEYKLH